MEGVPNGCEVNILEWSVENEVQCQEDKVYTLKKSLYGLKQPPHVMGPALNDKLLIGFY